jgi:hypothetical protein
MYVEEIQKKHVKGQHTKGKRAWSLVVLYVVSLDYFFQ